MKERKIKAAKNHTCDRCNGVIRKGNLHKIIEGKEPVLDENDDQTGIWYYRFRAHLNDNCDGVLKYVEDPKKYLEHCIFGRHEFQEIQELDDYVGCHPVYIPTGNYICVNCFKVIKQPF